MEIVKKAIDMFYNNNIDPHAILAAWIIRERPPKVIIEKAAKDINRSLYTEEVLRKGNLDANIPLINIEKVSKIIDSYERSNPVDYHKSMIELDMLKSATNINEFISNGKMENWYQQIKEAEDDNKPSKKELRDKVLNLLKTTYVNEYNKVKENLFNTVLDIEDFVEKTASAMVNDTTYYYVSPKSLLTILDHYIENSDIKNMILKEYNKNLSKHANIDSSELIEGDRVVDVVKDLNTVHYLKSQNDLITRRYNNISIPSTYKLFSEFKCDELIPSETKIRLPEKPDEVGERDSVEIKIDINIPKPPAELINYLLSFDNPESVDYSPVLKSLYYLGKIKSLLGMVNEEEE